MGEGRPEGDVWFRGSRICVVQHNTALLFSRVMEECSVAGYSNVYSVQLCQQLMCYNSVKEHRNTQQHKQHSTLVEGI